MSSCVCVCVYVCVSVYVCVCGCMCVHLMHAISCVCMCVCICMYVCSMLVCVSHHFRLHVYSLSFYEVPYFALVAEDGPTNPWMYGVILAGSSFILFVVIVVFKLW